MKLISEQVTQTEIDIILRELRRIAAAGTAGDIVELGCYTGTSSLFIADFILVASPSRLQPWKAFHVYDSFEGLPDKTAKDLSPAGDQFKRGELTASKNEFIKNFKQAHLPLPVIHKGWFESLKTDDLPDEIAFAFLDGDYYSSIMSSLKVIWPKLQPGAVVVVDDYTSDALPGAQKAVDEWLAAHPAKLRVEAGMAIITIN